MSTAHYSSCFRRICLCLQHVLVVATLLVALTGASNTPVDSGRRERYACFNTILEISCGEDETSDEMLVFESARYGRNDTTVSALCQVPFTRNCDLDVQHPLSRACGGRHRCSLAINTAFFGDPCGYEEFLILAYRCVPVDKIDQRCNSVSGSASDSILSSVSADGLARPTSVGSPSVLFGSGYISSPNYPGKYYMDADCRWSLVVQPRQTIRLTILDFELDVRRAAICHDFLRVSYRHAIAASRAAAGRSSYVPSFPGHGRTVVSLEPASEELHEQEDGEDEGREDDVERDVEVFRDCGSLGKQVVDVPVSNAEVWFKTGRSSLTQRGFILHFEALGRGCPMLSTLYNEHHQSVQYFVVDDNLFANSSCRHGFHFPHSSSSVQQIHCQHHSWNDTLVQCVAVRPLTTASSSLPTASTTTSTTRASLTAHLRFREQPETLLGLIVGVLLIVLLTTLFVLLAVYFRHRRSALKSRRHVVIIDSLHSENAINDVIGGSDVMFDDGTSTSRIARGLSSNDEDDELFRDDDYRSAKFQASPRTSTAAAPPRKSAGRRAQSRWRGWKKNSILEWPSTVAADNSVAAVEVEYQLQQRTTPPGGGSYGRLLAVRPGTSTPAVACCTFYEDCPRCREEQLQLHRGTSTSVMRHPDLIPGPGNGLETLQESTIDAEIAPCVCELISVNE